ncbi:RNA polymerase sigma factor [Cohnella soli]|uniref:RNA polymerase sigma factor n=1 Tax=Cohnella soli TaxID=425005 RepID=A0ABW0I3G8_9BACL
MEIGKEQAHTLFDDYSTYVYRVAYLLTKSNMQAEDITQEAFIQAFRKFSSYDPNKPFKPWISKIAVNLARNNMRKTRWLSFFAGVPEHDRVDGIEASILENERDRELWLEVNKLSRKRKEVVVLHFYADLKLYEVADILGIPLGTCKSRLHSALNMLRKQMMDTESYLLIKGGETIEQSSGH